MQFLESSLAVYDFSSILLHKEGIGKMLREGMYGLILKFTFQGCTNTIQVQEEHSLNTLHFNDCYRFVILKVRVCIPLT